MERLTELRTEIARLVKRGVCLAFSGGVDSALLLALAAEAQRSGGGEIQAVTFSTRLHPQSDIDNARRIAGEAGVPLHVIEIDEFSDPEIVRNPPDRCYRCKKHLFSRLKEFAGALHLPVVMDGTNADDLLEYRPGLQALKELGISSPLAELGFSKREVRELARGLGLSAASRPSTPCLATRLPYGARLEPELLRRIGEGEALLREAGFAQVRLRVHGNIARIEVPAAELARLAERAAELVPELKKLGFLYVTLDLEGFRSGSMDLTQKGILK